MSIRRAYKLIGVCSSDVLCEKITLIVLVSRCSALGMDLLSPEDVRKIAGKTADDQETILLGHELSSKSEGLGYLGKHLSLILRLSSGGKETTRKLFVKTYELKVDGENFVGDSGIFGREQDFYRLLVEDVREVIGDPDWCPMHILSKERALVLEDISEFGFRMMENGEEQWALDLPHLETALDALASMHATSLLLERRHGKSLVEKYPLIFEKDLIYDEKQTGTPTRKWLRWQTEDLIEGVEYLEKYSGEEKKIIRENFEKGVMRIFPLSRKSEKYRNTLTHGDMWKNNLLFRYSDQGDPIQCRFVDFQFVRYAPPAHDLMHLLHFATKKDTRDKMVPHFMRTYYQALSKRLKQNGVNVEEEMTEEELSESCKQYRELALIQCLLSLHYILGSVTLDVDTRTYEEYEGYLTAHRKEYMREFFRRESYTGKITDLLEEYLDCYILRKEMTGKT